MSDKKYMTDTFYGLNTGEKISDGEWNEMLNFTADEYPVAMTRKHRTPVTFADSENGMLGYITSAVNADDNICIATREVGAEVGLDVIRIVKTHNTTTIGEVFTANADQHLLLFGRDVFVWPAMKLIKFDNAAGSRQIDTHNSVTGFNFTADTTTTLKFTYNNSANSFHEFISNAKVGDGIRIKNSNNTSLEADSYIISEIYNSGAGATDYFICSGSATSETGETLSTAIIERRKPNLDYCVQHKNRLWGCRYGTNDDGDFVNEIYGSALGDTTNFFTDMTLANGSYTISVGTGGKFTGIGIIDDYVIFFKEDRYYILSGTEPPFSLTEVQTEGCQDGSYKSICNINGYLYYKSNHGIMRMSSDSLPVCISESIAPDKYVKAIANTDGRKYYIKMTSAATADLNVDYMFVYDTDTGVWTRENAIDFTLVDMVRYKSNLLAVGYTTATGTISGVTYTYYRRNAAYINAENVFTFPTVDVGGVAGTKTTEGDFSWYAITGLQGLENAELKTVKNIQLRCKTSASTRLRVYIQYDGETDYNLIYSANFTDMGTKRIVISPPRQCDTYRLKFEGTGSIVIYSITQTIGEGGARNVCS